MKRFDCYCEPFTEKVSTCSQVIEVSFTPGASSVLMRAPTGSIDQRLWYWHGLRGFRSRESAPGTLPTSSEAVNFEIQLCYCCIIDEWSMRPPEINIIPYQSRDLVDYPILRPKRGPWSGF